MDDFFDNGLLAGMSTTLFYWFVAGAAIMGRLCWKQRRWFRSWFSITVDERCDAALNLSLFMLFASSLINRINVAIWLVTHEWHVSPAVMMISQMHLPWAMGACSLFLWWAMYRLAGERWRWWWCFLMWTGLSLGLAVALVH